MGIRIYLIRLILIIISLTASSWVFAEIHFNYSPMHSYHAHHHHSHARKVRIEGSRQSSYDIDQATGDDDASRYPEMNIDE